MIFGGRAELDGSSYLGDARNVVLLLRGAELGSPARAVHDVFTTTPGWDPWHRVAVIADNFLFRTGESQQWFNGNNADFYAVLRVRQAGQPRTRVDFGVITAKLYTNNAPDPMKILGVLQVT